MTPQQPSKSQRAYHWIKERISDGRYSPGYRLVLGQIARELDVSVVPVREAVRMLEAEGLVTFVRNVGAQVAMIEKTEYQNAMQMLGIVESAATALAAPYVDAGALARAREVNTQMRDCLEHFDPHRFTQLNLRFHAVLYENCPNPQLLDVVHRGWNRLNALRDSTFSFVPGRAHRSVDEHEQLLDLIERQADPLEIEQAARRHRLATLDAFLARQDTDTDTASPTPQKDLA